MLEPVKILPNYTYEDYIHWEGRWELIEGVPYAMSPAPVPKHQRIGANLIREFSTQLKKCKRCSVYQPLDYHIDNNTILQPDMLIVCGPIEKKYLDFPPALVIEILSPATALKDRHTKFCIYQSQDIKYYLIVSPDNEEVEIYELTGQEDKIYKLKQQGHDFPFAFSLEECEAKINFKEIW